MGVSRLPLKYRFPAPLLGMVLFDLAYRPDAQRAELQFHRHDSDGARTVSGFTESLYFRASVVQGRLTVPREKYRELYEMEGVDA